MKSERIALVLLPAILFAGWLGCSKHGTDFVTALQQAAEKALNSKEPQIEIASITDFEWHRLCIFGPYTSVERINEELGYEWPEAKSIGIELSETYSLLVFEEGGKVVKHVKFPRAIGAFEGIRTNCLPRREFVFAVQRKSEDSGAARLIFTPMQKSNSKPKEK